MRSPPSPQTRVGGGFVLDFLCPFPRLAANRLPPSLRARAGGGFPLFLVPQPHPPLSTPRLPLIAAALFPSRRRTHPSLSMSRRRPCPSLSMPCRHLRPSPSTPHCRCCPSPRGVTAAASPSPCRVAATPASHRPPPLSKYERRGLFYGLFPFPSFTLDSIHCKYVGNKL
jgi:hypothetical protein